jgi:RNA polymerase sigma-70 factor (ECF subfamily)
MTPRTLQKVSSTPWDWDELRRFCFSQAMRVVSNPVAADEAAQAAIVRAWRHRDSCREPERPHGWIRRIARNEALRAVGRRPNEVLAADPVEAGRNASQTDDVEQRLVLAHAIARLSPADRELARLRYYEDLTCASLAEHFSTSEGTVKVRLHRLRRRLRELLEEQS